MIGARARPTGRAVAAIKPKTERHNVRIDSLSQRHGDDRRFAYLSRMGDLMIAPDDPGDDWDFEPVSNRLTFAILIIAFLAFGVTIFMLGRASVVCPISSSFELPWVQPGSGRDA